MITSGGDGTLIEYRVPGLRDWGVTTGFTVPTYQRNGTTFTLYARQSGREITTQYTTSCPVTARVASPEPGASWQVSVLGNPVDDQVQLRLSGLAAKQLV